MSFSSNAKAELCRAPLSRPCCAAAEAYGALLYANAFTAGEIRIVTGSPEFARRLPRLWERVFGFGFDSAAAGRKTVLCIRDAEKIQAVFRRFDLDPGVLLVHHVNFAVLEEDCCRAAFVRGAFLAGGSVTDPEKRSHLELVTDHRSVAGESVSVLQEMGFDPRETGRGGRYVIYFKQYDAIGDFLTAIGAPGAALGVMTARVEREMRSAVNRKVNCDSANADKIVSAAQAQLDQIRALGLDDLPPDLREIALLRIANPAASLADLAALADPPMSKSAVNHRMRKLMRLGNQSSPATARNSSENSLPER